MTDGWSRARAARPALLVAVPVHNEADTNVPALVSLADAVFRPGRTDARDVSRDYCWLIGLALLMIATGMGLRDPWPADEPRFALVARDMVATGDWLVPRVGGDIYADKPPLFFWLIGLGYAATDSLRFAFMLPSVLSALGCVLLIYDLSRRFWNRETALTAGFLLLTTVQFVWQARQAQIDATLCFWTTLSLYGLLRHLLLGPAWGWYAIGWAAAGLGVITKGVGFLPLLVLIPFALLRDKRWSPRSAGGASWKWLLGPPAFLLAVSVWLAPMLLASRTDPALAAYRDEILFRQTVTRYADAWHHREPFWYFIVEVIPWLWLPLTALLPWLVPRWRAAWRAGDMRVVLPLCWVILVVLFFSFSSGKRGVYVLPAVPAAVLICGPYVAELAAKRSVQRVMFTIACAIPVICFLALAFLLVRADKRAEIVTAYEFGPLGPLALIAVLTAVACLVLRGRNALLTFGAVLAGALTVVSFWINPAMNAAHSGATFVERVERTADAKRELGLVAFKEQYLLNMHRAVVHFGHARWREADQEAADAAQWLNADPTRQLIVAEDVRMRCFGQAEATSLGTANRIEWYLVSGRAEPDCAAHGKRHTAQLYVPPVRTP